MKNEDRDLQLMQNKWKSLLDPILAIPMLSGQPIENIFLVGGAAKTISHRLGRKQQGWFLTSINADTNVWQTGSFNEKTITLKSSADVTINIWVY